MVFITSVISRVRHLDHPVLSFLGTISSVIVLSKTSLLFLVWAVKDSFVFLMEPRRQCYSAAPYTGPSLTAGYDLQKSFKNHCNRGLQSIDKLSTPFYNLIAVRR